MADIVDRTFSLLLHLFRVVPLPYAVVGGFAGNVWGVNRATLDKLDYVLRVGAHAP